MSEGKVITMDAWVELIEAARDVKILATLLKSFTMPRSHEEDMTTPTACHIILDKALTIKKLLKETDNAT